MPYFPLAGFCFGLSGYVLYGSSLDRMAAAAAARPAGGIGPLLALFAPPLVLQGINGSCVWGPCTKLVANRVPPERLASFMGVVRIIGTLGAVAGFSLGLGIVALSGGLNSIDAYRTSLRCDACIAAAGLPFAIALAYLHRTGYPNPWKAARAGSSTAGALPPVQESEAPSSPAAAAPSSAAAAAPSSPAAAAQRA